MGKGKGMKPFVYISGLSLEDNNRGTAALGYGAISFLKEKGILSEGQTIIHITERSPIEFVRWLIKVLVRKDRMVLPIDGQRWVYRELSYLRFEKKIVRKKGFLLKLTMLHRIVNRTSFVAAINGGDGFSDIYGGAIFEGRLSGINFSMRYGIPLIILPQTIGPFKSPKYLKKAKQILKYATKVYVRDECFATELDSMGIQYEITNDLSYFMKPIPWDVEVDKKNAIGLNISGLAWDNCFHTLTGKFDNYKMLINKIITLFQSKGKKVYLISHSYNYKKPELYNDDLKAAREAYNELADKTNVILIDKDLISPQVKYLISQMSFFVGTRMHANFAAIYSNVPLFGLAYSYKFKGAFEKNGIFNRTAKIDGINGKDIDSIVFSIEQAYKEDVTNKH